MPEISHFFGIVIKMYFESIRRPTSIILRATPVETIVLPHITLDDLKREARDFATRESSHHEPLLFGVTDGKAIGTYFEHKFRRHLQTKFTFDEGSSARVSISRNLASI